MCKPMELSSEQLTKLVEKIVAVKDEDINLGAMTGEVSYLVLLDSGSPKLGRLRVNVRAERQPGKCRLSVSDAFGYTLAQSSSIRITELFYCLYRRHNDYHREFRKIRGNTNWPGFLREFSKFLKH